MFVRRKKKKLLFRITPKSAVQVSASFEKIEKKRKLLEFAGNFVMHGCGGIHIPRCSQTNGL